MDPPTEFWNHCTSVTLEKGAHVYCLQKVNNSGFRHEKGIWLQAWCASSFFINEPATGEGVIAVDAPTGKLGAADLFTKGHCGTVVAALRLD